MTKPAAIMGSLVDARNVGAHKSVKLTVHVPAELAMQVFEAFGWPTMADPVSVAIARLNIESEVMPNSKLDRPEHKTVPASADKPARASRYWHEMTPAQQAGILCANVTFHRFMIDKIGGLSTSLPISDAVARRIREICCVKSRADILPGTGAAEQWRALVSDYRAWVHEPEFVA